LSGLVSIFFFEEEIFVPPLMPTEISQMSTKRSSFVFQKGTKV